MKFFLLRVLLAMACAALAGCLATTAARVDEAPAPDASFNGWVALERVSGQRASLIAVAVEQDFLKAFPAARWSTQPETRADLALEIVVQDARQQDRASTREDRSCRRYSEPNAKAKTVLEKLVTRQCLDWEIRNVPCLTRRYEVDVLARGFRGTGGVLVMSQRRVLTGEKRTCGSDPAPWSELQFEVEAQAGPWVLDLMRPHLVSRNRVSAPATTGMAVKESGSLPSAGAPTGASAQAPGLESVAPVRPLQAHALVIGNGAYGGSARLDNPVNDARLVAERLTGLGFQVTRVEDADRETLVRALTEFKARAASSDLTVMYYSGHGMQIDGLNYMLPLDAPSHDPQSIRLRALPVADVIESYLPGKTRLVFLDACRDNPALASSTRGFNRGLAPMRVPEGTLIAYATKEGGLAEDGVGQPNSPFTAALAEHLGDPDDIVIVLRRVREKVMRATQGRQQPWDYGALTGGTLVLSQLKTAR